jgi:hypothetical protein
MLSKLPIFVLDGRGKSPMATVTKSLPNACLRSCPAKLPVRVPAFVNVPVASPQAACCNSPA